MTHKAVENVSERELQEAILDAAHLFGWMSYHTYDSRRSTPGFPDLVLVRPPQLIFAELKSEKGKLTADQQRWLTALATVAQPNADIDVVVWKPSQLDEILEVLK